MLRIILVAALILTAVVGIRRGLASARDSILARVGKGTVGRHDFAVFVQGWTQSELERILTDFCGKYDLPRDTFIVEPAAGETLQVRSHSAIEAAQVFTLVNYIHYPEALDLTDRQLAAVGELKLSKPTGLPPGGNIDDTVWIYVPADDQDYDLTYVQQGSGRTYRVSFTNFSWVAVDNPRMSATVRQLIGQASL